MFFEVALYGTLAGAATIAGILLVLKKASSAKKYSINLISFAAGVLLAAAFLDLMPEAAGLNESMFLFVLLGIVVFYFIENLAVVHMCKEEDCKAHQIGMMSAIGIGFHSLIDGIAIAAGFSVSPALGIITAFAVIAHEFPEGVITMSLLLHAKFKRNSAILFSVLVAAATPIGAMLAFPFLNNIPGSVLGAMLAFAAGSFIYIASSDLIPETHKKFDKANLIAFLAGVVLIYAITKFAGI